jgi:hypothetical protein
MSRNAPRTAIDANYQRVPGHRQTIWGRLVFNGATWLGPGRIFPGVGYLATQVSCASATFCMAVSGSGYPVNWDGNAWSAPVNVIGPAYGFSSVSCPAKGDLRPSQQQRGRLLPRRVPPLVAGWASPVLTRIRE